jgi:hypothetical protein
MQNKQMVSGPINIPEEKREEAPNTLLNTALSSVALSFLAGFWFGLGFYWLKKPGTSYIWIAYFISASAFLGIATWRVYSIFPRTRVDQDSINS